MLKIAICDDNKEHRREINNIMRHILFDRIEFSIDMFSDGRDIMILIENNLYDFDVIFLDINMPIINGMEAARFIRENEVDTDIIFLTAHPEYVYEAFVYKAYTYLKKPVSTSRLARELLRYVDEWENTDANFLLFTANGCRQKLRLNKIRYIESSKRKVTVYTSSDNFEFYARLDDLEQKLGRAMIRTHQSYLVNPNKIAAIGKTEITLTDRKTIPVSKRYYESVLQAFDL